MRIGLDTDPVGRDGSGNESYLRGMVGGLQRELAGNDDRLVLVGGARDCVRSLADRATTDVVPAPGGLRGDLVLGSLMRAARVDVAVGGYNAPFAFRGPRATIVHDVAFRRVPETYPRLLRARIGFSVARSVAVSDLIVTSSEFSRDELVACYPRLEPSRVVVTYSAPDDLFGRVGPGEATRVRDSFNLPDRFVLAVGNVQPRKNLARLARACAEAGVPLVAVGQPTWRAAEVVDALRDAGVRWLGRVSQPDLAGLYAACTVFAYPSLYEGFGLPVVEAMAAGAPVLTSSTTSLREVAGDAALTVDPTDVAAIAGGLRELLSDPAGASELADRGRRRAAEFSWRGSAAVLLDALRRIA